MVPTLDTLLSLPLPVVALLVLALWGTVALVIHFKVVPWICGADGRRLGRFEA